MPITAKTEPVGQGATPLQSLFQSDIEDRVLLSVHLLGKPTSAQLYRLHQDQVKNLREMQAITARLSRKPDAMLAVIKPFDIEMPIRKLPYVYLDTTQSRRHLQKTFGVPYKRPPVLPSRDWRFLRHDGDLVDELVAFELTARSRYKPFGYESHFDTEGVSMSVQN